MAIITPKDIDENEKDSYVDIDDMSNVPPLPFWVTERLPKTLSQGKTYEGVIKLTEYKAIFYITFESVTYVIKVALAGTEESFMIKNEALVSLQLKKLDLTNFCEVLYYGKMRGLWYSDKIVRTSTCDITIRKKVPGITYRKFIKSCDISSFTRITKEIFTILYKANVELGFTHYDLHWDNIIVSQYGHPIIIDYENSYVRTDFRCGVINSYGSIDRITWWVADVFKFLAYSYMTTSVLECKKEIENLFETYMNKARDIYSKASIDDIILKAQECGFRRGMYEDPHIKKIDPGYIKKIRSHIIDDIRGKEIPSTESKITKLYSRKDTYDQMHKMFTFLLNYFKVNIGDICLIDPLDYIPRLDKLNRYYAFRPHEVRNADFSEFMKLVASL